MRDTRKSEDYFLKKIQSDTARIEKFETILRSTEPSNERGARIAKLQLFKLYLACAKSSYSMGAGLSEMYSYYLRAAGCYKDACTPADSFYDVVDLLSIGVLFRRSKAGFLPDLEIMAEKFKSQDGLVCFLLGYLQGMPLRVQCSQADYFNRLMEREDKAEILSLELSQWYQHHRDAHWYQSHLSKHAAYCGYWCFEIAALAKITGVDDTEFFLDPCYPADLARFAEG